VGDIMNNHKHALSSITVAMLTALPLISVNVIADENKLSTEQNSINIESQSVEKIVVTGSRLPKNINKIPGAINIISPEEVKRSISLTSDVTSLLTRTIPGYSESRQQMGNSGETLRGRVALRLFDGVPQGSPLREGNRSGIFTDMGIIKRVEVINGPSASEGVGASGGIINYISKTAEEEGTHGSISTQYRTQFEDDSEGWRVGFNMSHLNDDYDLFLATSFADEGVSYDGDSRRIGLSTSGSAMDTESDSLFFKAGTNFGKTDEQRLELSISRFNITGKGNYILVDGDRSVGLSNTSERGQPLGSKTSFNDFSQQSLTYTNNEFFGGSLWIQYYKADQSMRYDAEDGNDKQDPLIVPIPLDENGRPVDGNGDLITSWSGFPLIDQSEIHTKKEGMRTAWDGKDIFSIDDLSLSLGVDVVKDTARQFLALTDRLWVPPMEYLSQAPFIQLSYDLGDITITGGVRHENGELKVEDFTTVWAKDRRSVIGGKLDYNETLLNLGVIWRIADDWSVYASVAEGFTLPNAGIPLRNISCSNDTTELPAIDSDLPFGGTQPDGCPDDPQAYVEDLITLQAVIVENVEIGFNWSVEKGSIGASYYQSNSDFGVSMDIDPETQDYVVRRRPTEIEGYEMSVEYKLSDDIKFTAIYSHIEGMTRTSNIGPLDREMGITDIGPDKMVLTADWKFSEAGAVTLGARTIFDSDINEGEDGEESIDGYTLFDLNATYKLGGGVLSMGVDNLTNKSYFLSSSQIEQWRNYFKGQGRLVTVGYTINF
jgi:iron complex outermembrane receptor protein